MEEDEQEQRRRKVEAGRAKVNSRVCVFLALLRLETLNVGSAPDPAAYQERTRLGYAAAKALSFLSALLLEPPTPSLPPPS